MNMKRYAVIALLSILLVVLAFIFFRNENNGNGSTVPPPVSLTEYESSEPGETQEVTLFFLSEDDDLLHPEIRKIPANADLSGKARRIVEELIRGPQSGLVSPFPRETRLRNFFLTDEGVAYVDFSKEFMNKHLSGSSAEIATVYSVVNTLAFNIDEIKKVFILANGKEQETLGGHVNLSRPFLPFYNLIVQ
ncbi:MAG: GerMN domain-containing protein [Candidatus Aminicenantes bacterium]|nr:GerMN domain-containing protein [Candidatus Aminicenantes bacterium]